ncbi:MAG: putative glycoside hydrolase [Hyphomicrobiales bacterium]
MIRKFLLTVAIVVASLTAPYAAWAMDVKVIDADNNTPIDGAIVTTDSTEQRANADGVATLTAIPATVRVRASGYERLDVKRSDLEKQAVVKLKRFDAKALYLSSYGATSTVLSKGALDVLSAARMNALVIDVKTDRGLVPRDSTSKLAAEIGSNQGSPIKDLPALVKRYKDQGIYVIARIVTFKDNVLAGKHPEWAVRTKGGKVYKDRESLMWVDPFRTEAWDYNVAIAVEAAKAGVDEVQFDYVRFPDAVGMAYSGEWSQAGRVGAIKGFLEKARSALAEYNVFLSADLFGYVAWNTNDTLIGQRIEDLAPVLDYISPMLYPSGFQFGIPGHRNPVAAPYAIIYDSLTRAKERTGLPSRRFRPWLQVFKDYAFGGKAFGPNEVREQVTAANAFGSSGWMFWNARNIYHADDFATIESRN